jgi:gluconokinase
LKLKVGRSIVAKWAVSPGLPSGVYCAMNATETEDSLRGEASKSMMQTPCSDYKETKGLIYFARMLDKIRLRAEGRLAEDYFTGVEDPTFFDARCTRFLGVKYDELAGRTLQGGSDEEILEWCFEHGRRPSAEEIEIWNAFLAKRGWRDAGSEDLQAAKERAGWADRDDIQTWVDLHDAEEGRRPNGR